MFSKLNAFAAIGTMLALANVAATTPVVARQASASSCTTSLATCSQSFPGNALPASVTGLLGPILSEVPGVGDLLSGDQLVALGCSAATDSTANMCCQLLISEIGLGCAAAAPAGGVLPTNILPSGLLPTGLLPTGLLPTGLLPPGLLPTGILGGL